MATEQDLRGEEAVHGNGKCATSRMSPYPTDSLMHDLRTELTEEEKQDLVALLRVL